MATLNISAFLTTLEKGGFLGNAQMAELQKIAQTQAMDIKALAREVVKRGWLTVYQINQIVRGQGKDLLLGPYLLMELLGEGGMGQVFKARHQVMNRVVALKVIRKERVSHPDLIRRFLREVRAAAQLSHPNVVIAHDAGQEGGRHFFVMEYLEGADLSRLVAERGPLPVAPACDYIHQAATGLQYVHERGLVHRDIKPQNLLLVSATETIKILDMGLARLGAASDDSGALTQEGATMGTPDYIAPEQALDAHNADIRADIYSLGCTFYLLLSGKVPFAGGSLAQKIASHMHVEPPGIETVRTDLPPGLAPIIARMMAKRPEARYQTPGEVVTALTPFFIRAQTISTGISTLRPSSQYAAMETMPTYAPPMTVPTPAAEPPTALEWPSTPPINKAHTKYLLAIVAVLLIAVVGAAYYIKGRLRRPGSNTPGTTAAVVTTIELPDKTGEIRSIALKSAKDATALNPQSMALSFDGRRALYSVGSVIHLWDLEKSAPVHKLEGHTDTILSVAFSPDGKQALTGGRDRTLRLWNLDTGKELRRLEGHTDAVTSVAFTLDGQQALSGSGDRTLRLWNLTSERSLHVYRGHLDRVQCVAISPDGRQLLSCGNDRSVKLWHIETEEPLDSQQMHTGNVYSVVFSPDGGRALSAGGDSTVRLWEIKDGKKLLELRRFDGHKLSVNSVAYSPDGTKAISGSDDRTLRLWALPGTSTTKSLTAPVGEIYKFEGHKDWVIGVLFFPGGRHVISLGYDSTLRLWGLP